MPEGATDLNVKMSYQTLDLADGYVQYGPTHALIANNETEITYNETNFNFVLPVGAAGFLPGQTVYYRVRISLAGLGVYGHGEIYSFVIARSQKDETPFAFILGFDSRSNDTNQETNIDFKENFWPDVGVVNQRTVT